MRFEFTPDILGIVRAALWFLGLTWKVWVPVLLLFAVFGSRRGRRW